MLYVLWVYAVLRWLKCAFDVVVAHERSGVNTVVAVKGLNICV